MLQYDKERNLLTFKRVENPNMGDRFDLLKDVRESYKHFLDHTLYEVLETINDCLEDMGETAKLEFFTEKVQGYRGDDERVRVMAYVKGNPRTNATPVVTLPYMDNLGKLHFHDRTIKSIVNKIASADDLSYDTAKASLSIVLKKKTIKVDCSSKTYDIAVQGKRNSKIRLSDLIILLAHLEGEDVDIHSIIRNPILQMSLQKTDKMSPNHKIPYQISIDNDKTSGSGLLESLTEDIDYRIGNVRDSLNAAVSLDRALGEILSRPVLHYSEGTYVTPAVLQDIKKNRINCIYIKTLIPAPTKKISGSLDKNKQHLQYTILHKGCEVSDYLRNNVPGLEEQDILVEDIHLPRSGWYMNKKYATKEILEFIRDMGEPGVTLTDKRIPYPFETEILSNYTLMYGDIYTVAECEAKGVSPRDWFCYKDNPTDRYDYKREKLTSDDLLAVYSTLGYMLMRDVNLFMDRDRDFLKKVELADAAMSKALTRAIKDHMYQFRVHILKYVRDGISTRANVDVFARLTQSLKKVLDADGAIEACDTTNYIAEISQATHITNRIKEAPEIMRQIATPYYGRICPFETPEGKQLGLVNNKAIGCHIVDGNMLVPVRRVIKTEDGLITISNSIEEISVKQEINLRISDVLQLVPADKKGYYKDTRIIAKVPNPNPNGERIVFADVFASDLDYVYAHTEQFISATTSLIPFACANDAVRDSFGSKMIKSAIYLLNPDKPVLQTSMYRDIFDSSEAYLVRAKGNGTVVDVSKDMLTVMYDGDVDETNYKLEEFNVTKDSVIFIRYKVKRGDRFTKGQVLADCSASQDGVFCPAKNELIAYMPTGYNYEDAEHVSERTTIDFISIGSTTITKKRANNSRVDTTDMYKYFKRGDLVTKITATTPKGDTYTDDIVASHGSGIWYSTSEVLDQGMMVHKLDLMGYNRLQCGDKMSGRHGNKGVVSKESKNSEMPMLSNGTPIRLIMNPHGLPSRMNIGQVQGGHLGLIATVLGIYTNSDSFNGATLEELHMCMQLAHELANAPDASQCRPIASKYDIPEDLIDTLEENMPEIMKWANTFDEYGDARLWNPVTGKWFPFPVTIGVAYVMKMKQEAETKIHVRAGLLEETYQMTSGQPTKGGHAGGGQGMGEMEMWSIAAYGAAKLLHEMCNSKSDNEVDRVNLALKAIDSPLRIPENQSAPRSVTNLMYILESFSLVLTDTEDKLPDVSYSASKAKYVYDIKKLIKDKEGAAFYAKKEQSSALTDETVDKLLHSIFEPK